MKIAIMTQPLGHNYGGIMQAWALQQVLKRMGNEPVTIDRQFDAKPLLYRLSHLGYRAAMKTLGKLKGPAQSEIIRQQITVNTREFVKTNIITSPKIDTTKKLKEFVFTNNFDAVIVGSDQVWRPIYSPNIYNYFFDFLEGGSIKRIAYAASFGVDNWEFTSRQKNKCAALAKRFNLISVRESSAVDLCRNHLEVDATVVLDPTLLLNEGDYLGLLQSTINRPKKYVYAYFLDKTIEKASLANRVSLQMNLPLFEHLAVGNLDACSNESIDSHIMPPVGEWLSGFKEASFVVTDSFHGMVFSIIFNKPFFIVKNEGRGSTRFESLLKMLNLSDRIVETQTEKIDISIPSAFYEYQRAKLKEIQALSLSILKKSLQ